MDPLVIGGESPSTRQSILGNFLRARPRGTSQSHPSPPPHDDSPPPGPPPPADPAASAAAAGHRRRAAAQNIQTSLSQAPSTQAFSQMLRRRRSAGALAPTPAPAPSAPVIPAVVVAAAAARSAAPAPAPATSPGGAAHRIRLVPHLDTRRSLKFDPIARDVREGDPPLRIGRFTDRSGMGLAVANALGSNKLAFKSKVVSRAHAEIWVEAGGRFFIRDTKSSSGTFLNHVRLSAANNESRPSELRDGDLLQLGVDYQGGTEDIYKCVKIKIELGREWQAQANPFNANALKQLKAIAMPQPASGADKKPAQKTALPDCCICLFAVTINQALFIAPCSHAFHFKCIRPLIEAHHPAFSCPLCRTFADLDEDVEIELDHELDAGEADSPPGTPLAPLPPSAVERDPGAETEVEADASASRFGASVGFSRRAPPAPAPAVPIIPVEDADAEMADADEHALPALPEGSPLFVPMPMSVDEREHSGSPLPVPGPARGLAVEEEEEEEEEEGEGSDGSGSGSGRVEGAHNKRKR